MTTFLRYVPQRAPMDARDRSRKLNDQAQGMVYALQFRRRYSENRLTCVFVFTFGEEVTGQARVDSRKHWVERGASNVLVGCICRSRSETLPKRGVEEVNHVNI